VELKRSGQWPVVNERWAVGQAFLPVSLTITPSTFDVRFWSALTCQRFGLRRPVAAVFEKRNENVIATADN
jgi:hypothetical protein